MSTDRRGWKNWGLPLGLTVLVGGLVAVALLRGPVELDPDTPEGTVQEYLRAITEERWDDAVAVIHPDWLGACDGDDLAVFATADFSAKLGHDAGISGEFVEMNFVEVGTEGQPLPEAQTEVDVTIIHSDGGGIGSTWSEYTTFALAQEDDFWWLVNDPWPGFLWNCRE